MSEVPHSAANEFEQIAGQARCVRDLALAVARDAHMAEDASQDALLAALRRESTPHNPSAWLRVSVRRLLAFRARSHSNPAERERAVARPERVEDPTLAVDRIEILDVLLREVRALEDPKRGIQDCPTFECVSGVVAEHMARWNHERAPAMSNTYAIRERRER